MESERRGRRGRGPRRGRGRFDSDYETRRYNEPDVPKKKPTFKQVVDICPEMTGINIKLKVIGRKPDNSQEVLMGDNTGAVNVRVSLPSLLPMLREGTSVVIRNGFVEMKNDAFIVLTTNEWGKIAFSDEDFAFNAKKENNISEVEYTIE